MDDVLRRLRAGDGGSPKQVKVWFREVWRTPDDMEAMASEHSRQEDAIAVVETVVALMDGPGDPRKVTIEKIS